MTPEQIEVTSAICGAHYSDDCRACVAARETNDARLASQPVPAPDLVERVEAVLRPWRNDETDGATATLLEIDAIIATAIRERNGSD